MAPSKTFSRKLHMGFGIIVLVGILSNVIAVYALLWVSDLKDRVLQENARNLLDSEKLESAMHEKVSGLRGFLLLPQKQFLDYVGESEKNFASALQRLRQRNPSQKAQAMLDSIAQAEGLYRKVFAKIVALRQQKGSFEKALQIFDQMALPARKILDQRIFQFSSYEERQLKMRTQSSSRAAFWATLSVFGMVCLSILLAIVLALYLARTLGRQIGSAALHVQSSSSELQTASTQQSSSIQEQSAAMLEISTTLNELLATSKMIAQSALRVSGIARNTSEVVEGGNLTVEHAQTAIRNIKQQVDVIVEYMLDLGRKSQRIGGILELINELAEQTHILAINATIEAVGAGDAGKRFGVVADEIRRLADRVGGSTKEIRALIEDMRAAVNTTIMATETGTKAVEQGSKQFVAVAKTFQEIAARIDTTHDAAREIELSTQQQTSSVEQVHQAVANVAQATKETEASTKQMLLTATELAKLSKELSSLIQVQSAS